MLAPIRALLSLRPGGAAVLIAGAVAVSLMFAATPFLIPAIAERYDVALGTAGLISAAQVLGFAATNFVAGRRWRPSRAKLITAAVLGVGCDLASALSGSFWLLLPLRFVAGSASGVFTWLAWADAMRSEGSMRSIAAVGPVSVLLGAPVLGWIASSGGAAGVYLALAVTPLPVLVLPSRAVEGELRERRRMSPARSNIVLLLALGTLTMAGSALFIFVGALASEEIGLSAGAVSIGFSVNAAAGYTGARWRRRPRRAWPWILFVGLAATSMVAAPHMIGYYLGMVAWGFGFWMAVPTILSSIAAWSLVPDERVGDAQSIMAFGRVLGPLAGGFLVGAGFAALAVFAGVGLTVAALLVWLVERYREGRLAPASS